jgi:hypothetical protein
MLDVNEPSGLLIVHLFGEMPWRKALEMSLWCTGQAREAARCRTVRIVPDLITGVNVSMKSTLAR